MYLPVENDNVAERGRAILGIIGSFWTELHGSRAMISAYGRGLGSFLAQQLSDFLYSLDTLSRKTMPVSKHTFWRRLVIRESSLNTSDAGALKYGGTAVFGANTGTITFYTYGGRGNDTYKSLDVATDWIHASLLCSSPVVPDVALVHGTDFWLDANTNSITFRTDPFLNANMSITTIYDDAGTESDREITLWAFDCQEDLLDMSSRFGVVLGLESASGLGYSQVVNAALDSVSSGASLFHLKEFLCGMAGVPLVRNDVEIVEDVHTTAKHLVITTDREAYLYHLNATASVAVGATVHRGDLLDDTVQVLQTQKELHTLSGLTIDRAFNTALSHPISFPNEARAVTVSTDVPSAKTKLEVSLFGDSETQKWFWEQVHAKGVASGTTFANTQDIRSTPVGEPTVAHIPANLNPFDLLMQELRPEFMAAKVKPAQFMRSSPEVSVCQVLMNMLPARMQCLVLVEHTLDFDYIGLSDTPSATQPGASDSVGTHVGVTFTDEALGIVVAASESPGYFDRGPVAWAIENPCP